MLTVIIPLRDSIKKELYKRLHFALLDTLKPDSVSIMVVDDGSTENMSRKIKNECLKLGIHYEKLASQNKPFSLSRSRNYGAIRAQSRYIVFQDVDLITYDGYYQDLLEEIDIQCLDSHINDFINIGVLYLSEYGTEQFLSTEASSRKKLFYNYYLEEQELYYDLYAPVSSVILINRQYYLQIGGHNESFNGWGFEDSEFVFRSLLDANKFPLPRQNEQLIVKNYSLMSEYRGWRSAFRLYGEQTRSKGIYLFHAWHKEDSSFKTAAIKQKNRTQYNLAVERFLRDGHYLRPLPDQARGKTLLFNQTPFSFNISAFPSYGDITIKYEQDFSPESLLRFIRQNKIDRVVFDNPYASEHRLSLFKAVRENKIPLVCYERGALRDSVSIDPNGFNADSSSYDEENWNYPISEENQKKVHNYIEQEKLLSHSLELQQDKIGAVSLRKKLGIQDGQKVLFVPMQTRSDTVVRYFTEKLGGFDAFLNMVQEVADGLPEDWTLVVKKHPLSKEAISIEGAVYTEEANVKDLLEIADMVLLINSGVGVMSMMWEVPTLYAGDIFYGHDDINRRVESSKDVLKFVKRPFRVNKERMLRYMSFLINDFYSFANFTTEKKDSTEDSWKTITSSVDYYTFRFPNDIERNYYRAVKPRISSNSALFDVYRQDLKKHPIEGEEVKRNLPSNYYSLPRTEKLKRKFRKLQNDPVSFVLDSKLKVLKPLQIVAKKML